MFDRKEGGVKRVGAIEEYVKLVLM